MRLLLASLVVVTACGNHHVPGPDAPAGDITSLAISPTDQELLIDGATPASLAYTLTATFQDGHREDITDRASFSLTNAGLGSFTGGQFTSGLTQGGYTTVVGAVGNLYVSTGLVVRIRESYPDPGATGLPADPSAPFSGPADASRAPEVVYPNDTVLVPPNLRLLEIHFQPGANNTLFEIAFENDLTDIRVYTRCTVPVNGGCIYTPDAKVWQWIAQTNRGGDAVAVRVRATDDAGSGVGTSADTHVAFSYEDVKGGIYYWKASGGTTTESAIMRFDFGDVAQTTAQRFVGPDMAGGKCVGCHALSRDGKKLVAAAGGWDVEDSLLVDVDTVTRMATPVKTAFSSWNPDGSAYVGVFADTGTPSYNLMVVDGTTGQLRSTIDVGATATNATSHPDWSPDGKSIAFVREGQAYGTGVNNQRFYEGGIQIVQDQGGSFGAPVTVVPAVAGKNRYYPSFSPDNRMLVFNESTCPSGTADKDCDADSDPSASIYVVAPTTGATPIALSRANAPGKLDTLSTLTSSWPKWAPFEFQRTGAPGSRVMWLTFSSTRNYGLRKPPAASNTEALSGTLLWMVAIDPDRALAGGDPSYPAFCLPFQDVASSNHIAQWTQEVLQ